MSTFSGGYVPEEEDGAGWGGLVESAAERRERQQHERELHLARLQGRLEACAKAITGERPILFSSSMVRAILVGIKTQTRRVVKNAPAPVQGADGSERIAWDFNRCRYGVPDDQLWVRETWQAWKEFDGAKANGISEDARLHLNYPANGNIWDARLRPSIHMPRWASRITLEITDVRVERLQEINEKDAMAEGVRNSLYFGGSHFSACEKYARLWEQIHGEGAWKLNPFVWVISFKKVKP